MQQKVPTVQLKHGDIFDGPSDLIVLPCSTSGTVTAFIRHRLIHHNIPFPESKMSLGDVRIEPFVGGENIAQFVGYAASVRSDSSSLEAIKQVGIKLGEATKKRPSIRSISAPLLGTGAGGLKHKPAVEALSNGFKSTAHQDAQLIIHILEKSIFNKLSNRSLATQEDERDNQPKALRVFISYSHTSLPHKNG